ncbi:hypothetical protein AMS68_003682 [Peltaster fructicola]|uniref:Uncharacterized protein n=1 Tax=Peltaster fructicola TaxID=286661 RepID=A0A6H0XU42_9PEZI|nr:hypothetical protein AMS68_003682 [Peltaster fructicola]
MAWTYLTWFCSVPLLFFMDILIDARIWWPHIPDGPQIVDIDSGRPPQLDTQRLGSRNGSICYSSRDDSDDDDDDAIGIDDTITPMNSLYTDNEDHHDYELLDSTSSLDEASTMIRGRHHDHVNHHASVLSLDSLLAIPSSSPTSSLIFEIETTSPERSVLGLNLLQDYIEDMSRAPILSLSSYIDAPLCLTDSTTFTRAFAFNCRHVHSEKCYEEE